MRETRLSGSMSGRWKRGMAYGSEPRRGNPDTRTYRCLHHRATSRLYFETLLTNGARTMHVAGLWSDLATP
jgi:hypothetical protein